MVWPILVIFAIIVVIALLIYRKNQGSKGFPLNRFCLNCKKRFPDNISNCPYCGEPYFNFHQSSD